MNMRKSWREGMRSRYEESLDEVTEKFLRAPASAKKGRGAAEDNNS